MIDFVISSVLKEGGNSNFEPSVLENGQHEKSENLVFEVSEDALHDGYLHFSKFFSKVTCPFPFKFMFIKECVTVVYIRVYTHPYVCAYASMYR